MVAAALSDGAACVAQMHRHWLGWMRAWGGTAHPQINDLPCSCSRQHRAERRLLLRQANSPGRRRLGPVLWPRPQHSGVTNDGGGVSYGYDDRMCADRLSGLVACKSRYDAASGLPVES